VINFNRVFPKLLMKHLTGSCTEPFNCLVSASSPAVGMQLGEFVFVYVACRWLLLSILRLAVSTCLSLCLSVLEVCTGVGMSTYPPKPAGVPAGMGKSFNLDRPSWRVWVRPLAVTGLNARPAGFRETRYWFFFKANYAACTSNMK